ncbi:hypothetical protein PMAYCL1PPCAC_05662, partial [Pristionchus mayeri]
RSLMSTFNWRDCKHYARCCIEHSTKVFRLLIIIGLVWHAKFLLWSLLGATGLLLTCIGALGVYTEIRFLMHTYFLLMALELMANYSLLLMFSSSNSSLSYSTKRSTLNSL